MRCSDWRRDVLVILRCATVVVAMSYLADLALTSYQVGRPEGDDLKDNLLGQVSIEHSPPIRRLRLVFEVYC